MTIHAETVAKVLAARSPLRSKVPEKVLIRQFQPLAQEIVFTLLGMGAKATAFEPRRSDFIKEEHRIFKEALLQIENCHGSYRMGGAEKIRAIFEALDGLLHPDVETNTLAT